MPIITPTEIKNIAWEGELVEPGATKGPTRSLRPVVSIGQPEIWPVAEALENETGQKWVAPSGNARYWLVRLACTLREPPGLLQAITEATQTLYLRPQPHAAGEQSVYAHNLFPNRLGADDEAELTFSLGPDLGFASGASIKAGEIGATFKYRKTFPIIQSYGAGESTPYWVFRPHATYPLAGSQFVYAVLVAKSPATGLRAHAEVTVAVQTDVGLMKFGTPLEAREHTAFTLP